MLKIVVKEKRLFNEETSEFINIPETTLSLEHSLVSISKWESKFLKSFFDLTPKTGEEVLEYIKCMTVNTNVNPDVYYGLSEDNVRDIKAYIESPMTATTIKETNHSRSGEKLTSELIYYYMIALGIPFECQKWHINRLLMLIKVCNIKNTPPKKMSRSEQIAQYKALNQSRRAALHTKG